MVAFLHSWYGWIPIMPIILLNDMYHVYIHTYIYICNDIYNYIHIWYAMFDSWHLHLCLQHFYALALLDVRFPSSPCSVGWTSSAHWEPRNHMKIMWFEQKKHISQNFPISRWLNHMIFKSPIVLGFQISTDFQNQPQGSTIKFPNHTGIVRPADWQRVDWEIHTTNNIKA
jgi:hypothetical protein